MGVLTQALRELREMTFPRYPSGRGLLGGRLGDERDYSGIVGNGTGSPLAAACISFIVNAFTQMRPVVVESDAKDELEIEQVQRHPAARLVRRPTYDPDLGRSYYSWHAWVAGMLVSFIGDGTAYSLKVRGAGGAGRPVQLWYTPHWMLEPKWNADDPTSYIDYYEYSPDGVAKIPIRVEDVLCIRDGINPANTRKGLSKLAVLLREIYTDEEAARWTASLLRNQAVPGLIVAPKMPLQKASDAEAIVARVEAKFTGDRRGRPVALEGPTELMQYGFSPDQMKLGDLRDIPEERISAALGIPAAVVGFGAGLQSTKVGATMAELVDLAWQNGVLPRARVFAAELTEQLVSDFDTRAGDGVEFAFDTSQVPIMADYHVKLAQRHDVLVTAAIEQRAEARRALGLRVGPRDKVYLLNQASIETDAQKAPEPPKPVEAPAPQLALPEPKPAEAPAEEKRAQALLEIAARAFESSESRTDRLARAVVESAREHAVGLERFAQAMAQNATERDAATARLLATVLRPIDDAKDIRKVDDEWCVFSSDGSRRFGCYPSRDAAEERLRQIEHFRDEKQILPEVVSTPAPPVTVNFNDGAFRVEPRIDATTKIDPGAVQVTVERPPDPELHLHIDKIETHVDPGAVVARTEIAEGAVKVGIMPPSADVELIRDGEGRVVGTRRA